MKNLKGILYILLSTICFGVMPLLAKVAYRNGLNSYNLLFLRFLFAVIFLIYYIWNKKIKVKLSLKEITYIFIIGLLGYTSTAITLFSSYNYIPIGLSGMILHLYPVIVTLLSLIIYKEKININIILSLILSIFGIYLLVGEKNYSISIKGMQLAFAAAVFYSLYVIGASNKILKNINSYVLTFYISIIAAISMFIICIYKDQLNFRLNFNSLVSVLLLSFISTIIALTAFMEGVKIIGPTQSAILGNLEPIVGMILGIAMLGESFNFYIIVGSLFIILSAIVICLRK